jgi:Flp pilus assembly pilin Flp
MKRTVKLRTNEGYDVRIVLENWGSGLDHSKRRWTLQEGLWQCVDSGDLAEEWDLGFRRPMAQSSPAPAAHETHDAARDGDETAVALSRGQTMVEYALIIAAIGVVAWGAYSVMGHNIGSMASGIDSSLTST